MIPEDPFPQTSSYCAMTQELWWLLTPSDKAGSLRKPQVGWISSTDKTHYCRHYFLWMVPYTKLIVLRACVDSSVYSSHSNSAAEDHAEEEASWSLLKSVWLSGLSSERHFPLILLWQPLTSARTFLYLHMAGNWNLEVAEAAAQQSEGVEADTPTLLMCRWNSLWDAGSEDVRGTSSNQGNSEDLELQRTARAEGWRFKRGYFHRTYDQPWHEMLRNYSNCSNTYIVLKQDLAFKKIL